MTPTTSESDALQERLLGAIHDPDADVELLAHEIAASDDAQAYLVEVVQLLSAVSATSPAAARAAALLEHGLVVAAALADEGVSAESASEAAAVSTGTAQDSRHDRRR